MARKVFVTLQHDGQRNVKCEKAFVGVPHSGGYGCEARRRKQKEALYQSIVVSRLPGR